MHTTLFAAIMAGSTGKQGFSNNREAAAEKKDFSPQDGTPLPSRTPAGIAADSSADVSDEK